MMKINGSRLLSKNGSEEARAIGKNESARLGRILRDQEAQKLAESFLAKYAKIAKEKGVPVSYHKSNMSRIKKIILDNSRQWVEENPNDPRVFAASHARLREDLKEAKEKLKIVFRLSPDIAKKANQEYWNTQSE